VASLSEELVEAVGTEEEIAAMRTAVFSGEILKPRNALLDSGDAFERFPAKPSKRGHRG